MSAVARTTIMGELCRPWGEHLVAFRDLTLQVYTVLDACGQPTPPESGFAFFRRHGLRARAEAAAAPPAAASGAAASAAAATTAVQAAPALSVDANNGERLATADGE